MGAITQIEIRPDMLIEMLSRTVLHCRHEMKELMDDVDAVCQDIYEYRRVLRTMDIALELLEAVEDFGSFEFVRISGDGEPHNDGLTLVLKRREEQGDDD